MHDLLSKGVNVFLNVFEGGVCCEENIFENAEVSPSRCWNQHNAKQIVEGVVLTA